jgi:D-3-phosphoglycerate dehydrogenase
MAVVCNDIHPDHDWARQVGATYVSLPKLLCCSDFVSLHIPLEDETYHLMSAEQFAKMKPSAVLVNTARGGIVDESALYNALIHDQIAGAALDVFECEPPDGSPLLTLDNVVMTSHIGAHTQEAVENMGRMAAANLLQCLKGLIPRYIVKAISDGGEADATLNQNASAC